MSDYILTAPALLLSAQPALSWRESAIETSGYSKWKEFEKRCIDFFIYIHTFTCWLFIQNIRKCVTGDLLHVNVPNKMFGRINMDGLRNSRTLTRKCKIDWSCFQTCSEIQTFSEVAWDIFWNFSWHVGIQHKNAWKIQRVGILITFLTGNWKNTNI